MAVKTIVPYLQAVLFTENNLEEVLEFTGLTQAEVTEDGNIEYQYDNPDVPTVIEVGSYIIGHPLRGPGQVQAMSQDEYEKQYVEI